MSLLGIQQCSDLEEPLGQEARVWGPPGCGKTTYLSRQIRIAAQKYGPESVLVTSFTRAAAAELIGRDLPLARRSIGTLHSHCYRQLGCPALADTHRDDWNREHPGFRLSPTDLSVEEMTEGRHITGVGDDLYGSLQILRASMVPIAAWPERVRRFAESWSAWKRGNGMVDFTDLLEIALRDMKVAPNAPRVVFVDEAQDLSRLQLALLRQWGRSTEFLVTAADDDQTILGFAGAAPEVLLEQQIAQRF